MSSNPIKDASQGATEGFLNWSKEQVIQLVKKFKDRKISGLVGGNQENIQLAKEQKSTAEYSLFKEHVKDRDFHILYQMGMTLRKLEKKPAELQFLRDKLVKKYDLAGLHIAQAVQSGIFSQYLANIIQEDQTPEKLNYELDNFLKNIDSMVSFIQIGDDPEKKGFEITTKIQANSPKTFIISGGGLAIDLCDKVQNIVMKNISGYNCEVYNSKFKRIYFLKRIDETEAR